jgi:hypothetical protein
MMLLVTLECYHICTIIAPEGIICCLSFPVFLEKIFSCLEQSVFKVMHSLYKSLNFRDYVKPVCINLFLSGSGLG